MSVLEMGAYPFDNDSKPLMNEIEERVDTPFGSVKVSIYGNRDKHPIITFHDIGLDSENNFQNFFQFGTSVDLANKFCVYNINAPGQEIDAKPLPENYTYPSMDSLANIVSNVVNYFNFRSFIGLGVGAGANVLLRYALNHQEKLDAMILINGCITKAGWIEWGYQKVNTSYLYSRGMTAFTIDYLIWHHFGNHLDQCHPDIIRQYRAYFQNHPNPRNLAMFIESYLNRTEIVLHDPTSIKPYLLNVPTLQLVGASSGFIDETVNINTKLDPSKTEWLKLSDSCGFVLDDKPEAVTEALILFLQGLGYFASLNVNKVIKTLVNTRRTQDNRLNGGTVSNYSLTTNELEYEA